MDARPDAPRRFTVATACYDLAGMAGGLGQLGAVRRKAYRMHRTMREAWHLVKRTARLGTRKIRHKAVTDTPCHYDSGSTTLQKLHILIRDAHWAVS